MTDARVVVQSSSKTAPNGTSGLDYGLSLQRTWDAELLLFPTGHELLIPGVSHVVGWEMFFWSTEASDANQRVVSPVQK